MASALFAAGVGSVAFATTRVFVKANGAWNLYRVTSYRLAIGNGKRARVDGACVVEATADDVRVDFVSLIPAENLGREALFGSVILQMTSTEWDHAAREAGLRLRSGSLSLSVGGTLYDGDTVNFNMGGYGAAPAALQAFVELASQDVVVLDDEGKVLARLPHEGLRESFHDLLRCGTI